MTTLHQQLGVILANTYTLYLKTQNYHWHVKGQNFFALHTLFETQYTELTAAVDEIAERIVSIGAKAPATFAEFSQLKTVGEGNSSLSPQEMLVDLKKSHEDALKAIKVAMDLADKADDQPTLDLMIVRTAAHQKQIWMLAASV